jgi:hypothetical protein
MNVCRTHRTYIRPDKEHIRHIVRLYKDTYRGNTVAYQYSHTNKSYIIETCFGASQPGLLRRKLLQQRPYKQHTCPISTLEQ